MFRLCRIVEIKAIPGNLPRSREEARSVQKWRRLRSRTLSAGYIQLEEDLVQLPDGRELVYEVVRARGYACACPITSDGLVVLVRQYRYPPNEVLCELPAGAIENGESPLEAAKRETAEEVGFASDDWIELGSFWTMPGRSDERGHLFLARDATRIGRPEVDEWSEVVTEPIEVALRLVTTVRDALCLRLARAHL
jgi:ADP-ribose pyrophosphatase